MRSRHCLGGPGGGRGSGGSSAVEREACIFARTADRVSQAACVTNSSDPRCVFCNETRLAAMMISPHHRKHVTRALFNFKSMGRKDIEEAAFNKIPEQYRETFRIAMRRTNRACADVKRRRSEAVAAALAASPAEVPPP